jgi:hypothetical protein
MSSEMEVTTADRERVVGSLKAATVAGALSLDEFEDRVRAVYAAESPDELETVLTRQGSRSLCPRRDQRTGGDAPSRRRV